MARDTALALQALAYVIRLHADLTSEHGAPTLGTQNQAVDFILADPDLSRAVATWAAMTNIGEASTKPSQVAARRAISARPRIPRKHLFQAEPAPMRASCIAPARHRVHYYELVAEGTEQLSIVKNQHKIVNKT